MKTTTDITIVGAGPYGLSIAAHLRHLGMDFRIIGSPMHTWRTHMPKGMHLKSAGLSATLFDPEGQFSLKHYCKSNSIPYQDEGLPISLELFTEYGMAFQKKFAPDLEESKLESLVKCAEGFQLRLENGTQFKSRKVILAVGIDYFRNIPVPLTTLPQNLFSHSAENHHLEKYQGKQVVVIGSGSSAIDMAVLLHEAGANPTLIARRDAISFGQKEGKSRTFLSRIFAPMSGLGPGWKNLLCADVPGLFRYLPDNFRCKMVKEFLGPSGGWFIRNRLKPVTIILGHILEKSEVEDEKALLHFASKNGERRKILADHVIAATGYKTNMSRINFLSSEILAGLNLIGQAPRLSSNFESSVPGLYFVGPSTATTFGPVMRFAVGAGFASKTISKHLVRSIKTSTPSTKEISTRSSSVTRQYQR